MKKILIFLGIISMSFSIIASESSANKIYKKLKAENENAFSMSFSKNMIDFFDMDIDLNGKEKMITGDFHEGRMLVLKENNDSRSVIQLFKSEHYELVSLESDDGEENPDEAYLFVDRKGKKVSEAHFVAINDNSVVVLSVFGDIKVDNKK